MTVIGSGFANPVSAYFEPGDVYNNCSTFAPPLCFVNLQSAGTLMTCTLQPVVAPYWLGTTCRLYVVSGGVASNRLNLSYMSQSPVSKANATSHALVFCLTTALSVEAFHSRSRTD